MICTHCKVENPDDNLFCGKCGELLEVETHNEVPSQSTSVEKNKLGAVATRKGWRQGVRIEWFLLLTIVIVYLVTAYVNRSTPEKTLSVLCDALAHGQYQVAYDQLSTEFKSEVPEENFTVVWMARNADAKIGNCVISNVSGNQMSAIGTMTFRLATGQIDVEHYTLLIDDDTRWKVSDCTPDCGAVNYADAKTLIL